MNYKIKHISFLMYDEREIIKCNSRGLFEFSRGKSYNSKKLSLSKPMTSVEVVKHVVVRNGDPVITMHNGEKVRVYLSADPTHPVVQALGILETHEMIRQKSKKESGPSGKVTFGNPSLEGLFADFPEW